MNNGGNGKPGEQAHGLFRGELAKNTAQAASSPALQRLSHNVHAEQEQAQTSNHSEQVKKFMRSILRSVRSQYNHISTRSSLISNKRKSYVKYRKKKRVLYIKTCQKSQETFLTS